ncbi:MAG TPA: glycoside hydrolase family 76 protein, partial [Polyangia bacterium]
LLAGCARAPAKAGTSDGTGGVGGDLVDGGGAGDGSVGCGAHRGGGGCDAGGDPGDGGSGLDPLEWNAHADAALQTLLLRYWSPSSQYLLADAPSSTGALTGYWTFAQALDAVLDGVERTGGARFGGWIEALYLAQDARGWSRDFYDDENWMALALIRAYDLRGDAKYLTEAKALYADIEAAWDTSCCGATPGGLWWDRPHTQKATAANAGAVITGVRLAARTGDAAYLDFATKVYAYWRAHMVDPTSYAVFDHIVPSGTISKYNFTYNEGLMIGAAVALFDKTGTAAYLADAEHIAAHVLAAQTTATPDGKVLFDGTNAQCGGDCQQFKGIAYRHLGTLVAADPAGTSDVAALLRASALSIWSRARGAGGLFAVDWAGPATDAASIDADSSAAMALSRFAATLGPGAPATPDRYEAEDGVVHALGLEATHGSFSGWGYLAGWNADGQWIDLRIHVASAGNYKVTLRYAAGAGDAARLVYLNGATAIGKQPLPSTGSWDTWASSTVMLALPAGDSTLSIIYNGAMGSSGWVNLDYVAVAP